MSDGLTGHHAALPDDTFDYNLEICYEVLLYLSSRLARLQPGQVLEFITSDPRAREKVPEWCALRDYTLLVGQSLSDGRQRFLIRR